MEAAGKADPDWMTAILYTVTWGTYIQLSVNDITDTKDA